MKHTILYIHGMGGGGDSRIPSILKESLCGNEVSLTVRTYSFDPQVAALQIDGWVKELHPDLILGESLGALHAIRVKGVPHILISPSLNAPLYLGWLSFLALIPGVTALLDHIYKPKPGDRQELHFDFPTLRKYVSHRRSALENSPRKSGKDWFHAFFGEHDHYRRSGIVSVRTWKKYFGDNFQTYPGTHFMEEEFIHSLLIPKILYVLNINK